MGRLTNNDFQTLAELTAKGAGAAQLLNDTKVYVTTNNINKPLSQAILDGEIGGGGGGGINFITNGDAKLITSPFTGRTLTPAATRPVQGATVGAANANFTIARNTTNPLYGSGSWYLTKSGTVNTQGAEQVIPFTVQEGFMASVIGIEMLYKVISGTFVAGNNTTDSDLIVYISYIDPVDSIRKYIEPSNFKFTSTPTLFGDKFEATFQTTANASSYELVFHQASTSTANYVLELDEISVGPDEQVTDAVLGREAFARVSLTTNQSIANNTLTTVIFNAVGADSTTSYSTITGRYTAPAAGRYRVTASVWYNAQSWTAGNNNQLVVVRRNLAGTIIETRYIDQWQAYATATLESDTSGSVQFDLLSGETLEVQTVQNSGAARTVNGNAGLTHAQFEKTGGNADVRDSRVVVARASRNTSLSIPNGATVIIPFDVEQIDTHSALSNGVFTAPSYGFYRVSATVSYDTAIFNAVGFVNAQLFKNGSIFTQLSFFRIFASATTSPSTSGSTIIELNAGDTIDIRTAHNEATTRTLSIGLTNHVSIEKVSGPSTTTPIEDVIVRANSSTTAVTNTPTTVIYTVEDADTHSAYNLATGTFTAPSAGTYLVSTAFTTNAVSVVANNNIVLRLLKNGSVIYTVGNMISSASATINFSSAGTASVSLIAGDTLQLQIQSSVGVTTALTGSAIGNFVSIVKDGKYI